MAPRAAKADKKPKGKKPKGKKPKDKKPKDKKSKRKKAKDKDRETKPATETERTAAAKGQAADTDPQPPAEPEQTEPIEMPAVHVTTPGNQSELNDHLERVLAHCKVNAAVWRGTQDSFNAWMIGHLSREFKRIARQLSL